MNVLDENILGDQRELLRCWRIRVRHVGYDLYTKGVQDEGIIPLLRVSPAGLTFWRPRAEREEQAGWR